MSVRCPLSLRNADFRRKARLSLSIATICIILLTIGVYCMDVAHLWSRDRKPPARLKSNMNDDEFQQVVFDMHKHQRVHPPDDIQGKTIGKIMPTIHCPYPAFVGNLVDGGKWMCAPWRARNLGDDCKAYSLGVGNDVSWEKSMSMIVPKCRIWSIDDYNYTSLFEHLPRTISFVQVRIEKHCINNQTEYDATSAHTSIPAFATQHNHKHVEFMKIDIEGSEYAVVPDILQMIKDDTLSVCQMYMELHIFQTDGMKKFKHLMAQIERTGFELFKCTPNTICGQSCWEYSWVHRRCFESYGLRQQSVTHKNFPEEDKKLSLMKLF